MTAAEARKRRADEEQPRVWLHVVDYLRRDDGGRMPGRRLLHRGYFVHDTPRVTLRCRLLGHRPVVDGVDFGHVPSAGRRRSRWVCCDRCAVRLAQPVSEDLVVGQPYTGGLPAPGEPGHLPGPHRGALGAELVIGGAPTVGAEVKVGNAGSEHTLAGQVTLGRLGGLYLHTEHHGAWLQRRLNPTGYDSRVIGVSAHDGRVRWEVWAKRDVWSSSDPRWMHGSVRVDPRDWLLGDRRYWYENVGEPQPATIRLAHGDDHDVLLQLQRQTHGREKGGRRTHTWCVDVHVMDRSISTRSDNDWKDGLVAWSVDLPTRAVDNGRWIELACDLAAARVTEDRARSIYHHTTGVPE